MNGSNFLRVPYGKEDLDEESQLEDERRRALEKKLPILAVPEEGHQLRDAQARGDQSLDAEEAVSDAGALIGPLPDRGQQDLVRPVISVLEEVHRDSTVAELLLMPSGGLNPPRTRSHHPIPFFLHLL